MITPESIIVFVADYYKIPIDLVLSTSRKREYVKVRQVSCYFIRELINRISLQKIANNFPGKCKNGLMDHATIISAINKVKGYIETDKSFKREIEDLTQKIKEDLKIIPHVETESERKQRLLLNENIYLKDEITNLHNTINRQRETISDLRKDKRRLINPSNNRAFSGFREHSL
jgi:predicted RNase H-like nuclease (RuvC/YqgF family)